MVRIKKKALCLALAAAAVLSVSACGNGTSGSIRSTISGTTAAVSDKRKSVDTKMSEDQYKVFLIGKHKAVLEGSTDDYEFDFKDDNSFFGHSTAEEDDFGTYSMQFDSDQTPYLTITCDDAADKYRLYLTDDNNVVLKSDTQGTFTLAAAE